MICYTICESPLGPLLLAGDDEGLREITLPKGKRAAIPQASWQADESPLREALRQLAAYFAGELRDFNLPLVPEGTPFQQHVWQELQRIPYGETVSYGEVARRIGQPTASRAVGAANGRNPLAIVIPCHRVIESSGALGGYGGGLDVKEALLALERRVAGVTRTQSPR